MTDPNHPLVIAARYSDAKAEEHGLEKMVEDCGLDLRDVLYLASQRAMRLVILLHRGPVALKQITSATVPTQVRLSEAENEMMESLRLAYLDGLTIGWEGRGYRDAET